MRSQILIVGLNVDLPNSLVKSMSKMPEKSLKIIFWYGGKNVL